MSEIDRAVSGLRSALLDFELQSSYARTFLSPSQLFTTASTEALEELNLKSAGLQQALSNLQIAIDTLGESR